MLRFLFGSMGSAKTANALMSRYNFIEKGLKAILCKPSTDTRDGTTIIRSRIGLSAEAIVIHPNDDITALMVNTDADVIIVDEAQFLTKNQIVQLRNIASKYNIPVWCYGLRTDFRGQLFEGSKALFELADDIREIESICDCGNKSLINARFDSHGNIITDGDVIDIGGNEKYRAVCWSCFQNWMNQY